MNFLLKSTSLLFVIQTMSSLCFSQQLQNYQKNTSIIRHGNPEIAIQPGLEYPDYPILHLPETFRYKQLPYKIDNSVFPFLRPVFEQMGASCGQAAAVGYNFCYEINRMRNLPSDVYENQYPSHFTWNFMNANIWYGAGVSYFHSYEVLKAMGCPNEATFGPITMDDPYLWMSGYEKYYKAMQNRVRSVRSIPVNTIEGLNTLKHWLVSHLENSPIGGVANFYSGVNIYYSLPLNSPEPGKPIIINWNNTATHALTIVGYNDSIRFDLNHDGQFTNHLDITNDGIVDISDWEIGGIKLVNSYGAEWGDNGFCYALYSSLAKKYGQGGMWNNAVHVLQTDSSYQPLLTIRAVVSHNMRGRLKLSAGISNDTTASIPERVLDFPGFNYQGGDFPMQGHTRYQDKEIEIGLDITPLIAAAKPGSPVKVFLLVDENDADKKGVGMVKAFSVVRYDSITREYFSKEAPFAIINNGKTLLGVTIADPLSPLTISPSEPDIIVPGTPVHQQFIAAGGSPPYTWSMKHSYHEIPGTTSFSHGQGQKLSLTNNDAGKSIIVLPFSFPFYGKHYDTLHVYSDGYIMLDGIDSPYPYLKDESLYLTHIRAIAPYMCSAQRVIDENSQGIWYNGETDKVVITWKTGFSSVDTSEKTNYKTILYPDGRIEFVYGEIKPGVDAFPVVGLSDGDGLNHQFGQITGSVFIEPGMSVLFQPPALPNGLNLDAAGLLTSGAVIGDLHESIVVSVMDQNRRSAEKLYTLTSGPAIIIQVTSGTDRLLEPGESGQMDLTLKNRSGTAFHDIRLKLTCFSPGIVIQDSIVDVQLLNPGEELLVDKVFNFHTAESLEDNQHIVFQLETSWSGNSFRQLFSYFVVSGDIEVSGPVVNGLSPDRFTIGEDAGIVMRLTRKGKTPAQNFTGKLTCTDPLVAFLHSDTLTFRKAVHGNSLEAEWKVRVNANTPPGRTIHFQFEATSGQNESITTGFTIPVGTPRILVIDLDGNNNSAQHISKAFNNLGILADNLKTIDSTLFSMDHVFLCLGVKVYNHPLTTDESNLLTAYVNQGGNLYMEGGATFGSDTLRSIHEKFRINGANESFFLPPDILTGNPVTIADGLSFKYNGDKTKINNLYAQPPASTLFTDKSTGFTFVVANDSITYRTIGSSVEFGGISMQNGMSRETLMMKYLEFFGFDPDPLASNFTTDYSETCINLPVQFNAYCSGNPTNFYWRFEGGEPAESFNSEVTVTWKDTGRYTIELTVGDGITSNTLIKKDYIRIYDCSSLPSDTSVMECKIYPNPSSGQCNLQVTSSRNRVLAIQVTDLQGKTIFSKMAPAASGKTTIPLDHRELSAGMYLVRIQDNSLTRVVKLVRY